jgi:ribosome-binding protein aMBF1 (putative translation factor)
MPKHNASPTPLPGQAGLKKPKDIGCEDSWWHTHEQNEISQLDGNLSEFEKAFLDEMDRKDLERKDERAEKKMLEETYEQTITYIRTSLGTRIQDLTAERQVLQTTVNNHDKLLVDFRRKHATEIKTLVGIKERPEAEENTKSNEAAIVHDMYSVQIKRLIDGRVVLQNQLNKAAFGALFMKVGVPKHTEAAVMGKSVA